MVYLCSGSDSEKLEWFKTINIAGKKLTDQELRNAVYHGPWVSDAKRHFSKTGCPAYKIGKDYIAGAVNRQDFLQTAISWIAGKENIESYMSHHQHDPSANEIWLHFQSVINWVKATFPTTRKEMKSVDWGTLYKDHCSAAHDAKKLEEEISTLIKDDDVTKNSGIYPYVLTRKERYLNIRLFTDNQKSEAYERQKGICPICEQHFTLSQMEADHITPWHEGGKTSAENCQMLCKEDNRRKSGR